MANRNTRRNRTTPGISNGYKEDRGNPVNSSRNRQDSGKKPWKGLTSKGARIGFKAPEQEN